MSRKDLTPQTREGGNWRSLPEGRRSCAASIERSSHLTAQVCYSPHTGTVPLSQAGSDPSNSSLVLRTSRESAESDPVLTPDTQHPPPDNRQPTTSNRQPSTYNQQPATGNRQPTAENRKPATTWHPSCTLTLQRKNPNPDPVQNSWGGNSQLALMLHKYQLTCLLKKGGGRKIHQISLRNEVKA